MSDLSVLFNSLTVVKLKHTHVQLLLSRYFRLIFKNRDSRGRATKEPRVTEQFKTEFHGTRGIGGNAEAR